MSEQNSTQKPFAKKISLYLEDGDPFVGVVISSPSTTYASNKFQHRTTSDSQILQNSPGMKRSFKVPFSSLSELIGNEWSTPFMNVSEDGPIFMRQNASYLDVLVQRAPRTNQTIMWYDEEKDDFPTPRCLFHFRLSATSEPFKFRYESSRIFIMDPFLGSSTTLRRAKRLCNVFDDHLICWGGMSFSQGLTVPSLTLLVNDFFKMPFNGDLYHNFSFWNQMKKDPQTAYKEPVVYETLAELVESL